MPRLRIILQSRTDSTRLPAKALLPVAGLPSAILAARRAANRGHELVFATTDRPIDDRLAALAAGHGLSVFRGDAEDVRGRFLAAAADLDDDDVIVRLTADNLVPDGDFVARLADAFHRRGGDYLGTSSPADGLPYGLSAEALRAGALRASAARGRRPADLEHVTPALRDAAPDGVFDDLAAEIDGGHLRCTLDDIDDYTTVTRLFDGIDDPVTIGWRELVTRLGLLPGAPPRFAPGARLVLGTAQLGAPYGSVRKTTPLPPNEAMMLVRRAMTCNAAIDTARAYPDAEAIVGRALAGGRAGRARIVTKLAPLDDVAPDAAPSAAADAAGISVLHSRQALGGEARPTLLLHRAAHLSAWRGAVWHRLQKLRDDGLIDALGVSVQSPEEAQAALGDPAVRLIQLPLNPLDRRWRVAGIEDAARQAGVEMHFRSVFLQGILLREPSAWPRIDGVDPAAILKGLAEAAARLGRANIADLCIAAVRTAAARYGDACALVIGAERLAQFEEIVDLFRHPPLSPDEAAWLDKWLPDVPDRLVNPALWPKA